ncbi:MAG: hypothetical protein E7679_03345 [Ruminococcaceae bacterium]|nr:hypothetical protein [Oscillospiraceae bacterium]
MKKFIAIMLCLAMLVSAVALTISATERDLGALGVNVADLLRPYGINPTFVSENISTAPVMDGVVNLNEYTSKRVFKAKNEDGVDLPYELNFGALAEPQQGYSVTEYVAQDDENIYIAFVYTENVLSVELRYNLSQSAIFDGAGVENTGEIEIDLPIGTNYVKDGYDSDTNSNVTVVGGKGINYDADFSFRALKCGDNPLTSKVEPDEYDAVAKRHFDVYDFENVTAEFRISKEAIMSATKENETEVRSIGYYCVAKREAFCDLSRITLQAFLPNEPFVANGYDSSTDFLHYHYGEAAADAYSSSWRFLRYICFYEDTYVLGQEPSTMPPELFEEATSAATTTSQTSGVNQTTDNTTVSTTTTQNTTNDLIPPSDGDPAYRPNTTTTEQTTEQTTVPEADSCQNSLSLSALAIVQMLGLGVALVAKKKEN